MNITAKVREQLGSAWIPTLYAEKVRSGRTRSYHIDVPGRENQAEILFTLLGIEIRVGRRRFASPDLAAARYIQAFARIGCSDFAVPYDITRIGPIADELEVSWQRSLLLLEIETVGRPSRSRSHFRSALVREMRVEIQAAGAGPAMPEFRRSTKQRPAK